MGTRSINLLSGLTHDDISEQSDMQSFKVQVENVCQLHKAYKESVCDGLYFAFLHLPKLLVPNETDTTYWCSSFDLSTVTNEKIYIHKVGIIILYA